MLKKLCLQHRPDFVFLAKPWIDLTTVPQHFWKQLNLTSFATNTRVTGIPNLWGLCKPSLMPTVVSSTTQQLSFSVPCEGQVVYISAVYASTAYLVRRQLWSNLLDLQTDFPDPWYIIGDFNSTLGAHEVRGSHPPLRVACNDFKSFTDSSQLIHVLTHGSDFTWCNGRRGAGQTEKRLARSMCNNLWLDFWDSATRCTLPRSKSDQSPLLLVLKKGNTVFHSHFKFHKIWRTHPDYKRLVKDVWSKPVVGCPMPSYPKN